LNSFFEHQNEKALKFFRYLLILLINGNVEALEHEKIISVNI
jgi:hypothetical protein